MTIEERQRRQTHGKVAFCLAQRQQAAAGLCGRARAEHDNLQMRSVLRLITLLSWWASRRSFARD